jgi:hypothetical protein
MEVLGVVDVGDVAVFANVSVGFFAAAAAAYPLALVLVAVAAREGKPPSTGNDCERLNVALRTMADPVFLPHSTSAIPTMPKTPLDKPSVE